MAWGSGYLIGIQQKKIGAILVTYILLSTPAYAIEPLQKSARLNMGFYAGSITERSSRSDIEISLNFWAKDVIAQEAEKQNLYITSSKATIFDNILDLKKAFEQGELDMIAAPPLLIAKYFNLKELTDGFMGTLEDNQSESLLLISRTDKNIDGAKDLQGKRLVMQEGDELADVFLDTELLKELQQDHKQIKLAVNYQQKVNRVILDVFFDKADVAVTYKSTYKLMIELNPEINNKIKILAEHPILSKNFSYFRKNYPSNDTLTKIALVIRDDVRGKQILSVFKTPELKNCKVAYLDNILEYYKEYLRLKHYAKK